MTTAQILVSIAGGGNLTGVVPATAGQTMALTASSTAGWSSAYWEIYDYPPGLSLPAGWSVDASGVYYFAPTNPTTAPPTVMLPASGANNWGAFMLRLRVNGNPLARDPKTGAPNPAFDPTLIDESTFVTIPSPVLGMSGIGFNMQLQADALRGWVGPIMASLRKCDNAGGGGSSVTGSGVWHSTAASLDAAASKGTANQLLATNGAATDTAWSTPAGDWSGAVTANVVGRINGATVPAAGALTTGNGLYVSGASALTYSALNLAGGAGWVTGVLPAANQAAQAMGGDVGGTTAASTITALAVTKLAAGTNGQILDTVAGVPTWTTAGGDINCTAAGISATSVVNIAGSSGTCGITASTLQFAIGVLSPTIKQATQTAASTAGQDTALIAQSATGTGVTSNGGNVNLLGGGSTNGTPGGVNLGDSTNGAWLAFTKGLVSFVASIATATITQAQNTAGAGTAFLVQAQAAKTGSAANGGALQLKGGAKDGAGVAGGVGLYADATLLFDAGVTTATTATLAAGVSLAGAAGAGAISCASMTGPCALPNGSLSWAGASGKTCSLVATAAAITITAAAASTFKTTSGTLQVGSDSGACIVYGSSSVQFEAASIQFQNFSATPFYTITPAAALTLTAATGASTSVTYNQADNTTNSATAAPTVHQAQNATGTTANGGSNTLAGGTGTSFGGAARMATNGTVVLVEACNVTGALNVVALARKSALTTTQMPALTGDGVIYIANAATAPTASSVGGGILYCSAGALRYRGTSGTDVQIAAA